MNAKGGKIVRFGVYEVDLASGELRKQGIRLRLQEQPFQVLSALLEQPGQVVAREELIRRLWPDGTAVEFDHGLNAAVTRLRQVLSDSAESPRYVETVARRGYRFLASAETVSPATDPVSPPSAEIRTESPHWLRRWPTAIALVCLAGVGAWWGLRLDPARPESHLKAVPLTSEPGVEQNVTFSPDGSQIAYEWDEGGPVPHVFIRQVGLGDPVRLTQAAGAELGPAWSRDGRFIAFLRRLDESKLTLIVAPVLGGVERKIAELPAPPVKNPIGDSRRLDWAADGQRLIVGVPEQPGGLEGLLEIRLDTGERAWLTAPSTTFSGGADHDPAVSPDGRTLAFVRTTSLFKREIFLMPLADGVQKTGVPFQLTFHRGLSLNPSWTRDGKAIVFVSGFALWRVEARAGAKPALIASLGGGKGLPFVGPRGRLAFSQRFADPNVWRQEIVMGSFSAGPPVPLISSTTVENSAEYSPDGSQIALQTGRSGSDEIWICASSGARCAQITALNAFTGSPRWSPDGKRITFDSDAGGHFHVYTVDATGGAVRRLTNHASDNAAPSWSRDGRWIYFMSSRTGRGEIWKMPADGGGEVQMTRNGGMMALESPDGKHLYYSSSDAKAKLFRLGPDGEEVQILDSLYGRSFALTKDRIYYLRHEESGEHSLRLFLIATGQDSKIATIQKQPINGLSVSSDGRHLIYSQVDSQGSDLMLVDNFR